MSPTPPHPLRRLRLIAVMAALATLAAACGLKPEAQEAIGFTAGTSDEFVAGDGFTGGDVDPLLEEELGSTASPTGGSGTSGATGSSGTGTSATGTSGTGTSGTSGTGTSGSGTSGGGTSGSGTSGSGTSGGGTSGGGTSGGGTAGGSGGGTSGGSTGGQAGGGGGGAAITGSDRTGVDAAAGRVNVAVHAPVTGAAPLPVTSFEEARDLYFRHLLTQQEDIGGFTEINISFADDRYQPSTAVQACRQLAADNFLLVGAGGTDQIQACGRFAEASGIPYFSAGVTEAGLNGFRNYFAFSMSYKQQGFLLAQYVAANYPGKKVAAIVTETENFNDAVEGWEAGVQQAGLDYAGTLRHPKGDNSWYNTFANQLAQQGVEVLYINSAPVDYIRFAQQANGQGFQPQFVGVGVTMGLNAVLGSGCPDVDGGVFFSPFPGLDWAQQNERAFFDAAAQFGTPDDDIALALWAQGKILAQLLEGYESTYGSNDLTREDFRNLVETSTIQSGVFPDLSYSAQDHFGASQVHVLRANCGSGQHETVSTFSSGF